METTFETTVMLPLHVETKVNGQVIRWRLDKAHQTYLAEMVRYGVVRWANDKAAGLKGMEKYDFVRGIADQFNAGEELAVVVRKASLPDDVEMALRNARAELLLTFKAITGLTKIADMVQKSKAVAQFFNSENVWQDEPVMKWVEQEKAAGRRDFVAEAQETLARIANAGELEDQLNLG